MCGPDPIGEASLNWHRQRLLLVARDVTRSEQSPGRLLAALEITALALGQLSNQLALRAQESS
jgi:hypothetical protein